MHLTFTLLTPGRLFVLCPQSHRPARHTIVEAHPDVVDHMTRTGWAARPGVRVLRGRWQDVLPELLAEAPYDGIFFDTYGKRSTDTGTEGSHRQGRRAGQHGVNRRVGRAVDKH